MYHFYQVISSWALCWENNSKENNQWHKSKKKLCHEKSETTSMPKNTGHEKQCYNNTMGCYVSIEQDMYDKYIETQKDFFT